MYLQAILARWTKNIAKKDAPDGVSGIYIYIYIYIYVCMYVCMYMYVVGVDLVPFWPFKWVEFGPRQGDQILLLEVSTFVYSGLVCRTCDTQIVHKCVFLRLSSAWLLWEQ